LEHVPSDEMDILISTVNDAEIGWKMDTCKLQKHHSNYCSQATTLAQIDKPQQLAGAKEFGKKDDKAFGKALESVQSY